MLKIGFFPMAPFFTHSVLLGDNMSAFWGRVGIHKPCGQLRGRGQMSFFTTYFVIVSKKGRGSKIPKNLSTWLWIPIMKSGISKVNLLNLVENNIKKLEIPANAHQYLFCSWVSFSNWAYRRTILLHYKLVYNTVLET